MTIQTTKIQRPEEDWLETGAKGREFQVGTVLWERYEIRAVLGSSALGELWRCVDKETNLEVALRWLPPDMRRSKPAMAMIHAGIRRIADQAHPNLATIRQIVYVGDQIYLVGDFAPGVDIGTWARAGADGRRTLDETLPALRQVAEALDFAHDRRIIHRNLKPSNIYLGPDGVARVTDFGLALHHHVTIVHGAAVRSGTTGAYLAPELREGGEADSASDQYALAALAWELLAGAPPEPDGDGEPPGSLPGSARAALRRALSKKPRNRFVTCADFVKALGGERVGGRRGRSAAEWRRIQFRVGIAATLLSLAVGLWLGGRSLVVWLDAPRTPPAPEAAPRKAAAPAKAKAAAPAPKAVERLVATTPLPVEGQPWVTQTAQMEFIWVPALGMWIGRFEVTNEEYLRKDPAHDSGAFREISLKEPRQPVVRVNFDDALAYAAWLTEQERAAGKLPEGWRYRLPARTEAIAYTLSGSMQAYPWGELWPPNRGNYADGAMSKAFSDLQTIAGYQDGFPVTAPVESSGENPWGLFGAGGNVWETTSKLAGSNLFGGWQGGGWDDHQPTRLKCDVTYGYIGNARGAVNGLRLVLARIADEAPPPPAAVAPAPAEPSPG